MNTSARPRILTTAAVDPLLRGRALPPAMAVACCLLGLALGAPAWAAIHTWKPILGGSYDWDVPGNWIPDSGGGGYPDGVDAVARMDLFVLDGHQTVRLNRPITLGRLHLAAGSILHAYDIGAGSGGTLTFRSTDPSGALLLVPTPSWLVANTITAPTTLDGLLLVDVQDPANRLWVGCPINGTGPLRLTGPGTVRFDSNPTNSYTGATQVWAGVLELDNDLSNKAIPGALEIGDNSGVASSAAVRLFQTTEIADNAAVTVNSDGLLDINGYGDVTGWLTVSRGNVALGTGYLQPSDLTMVGGTISSSGIGDLRLPANVVAVADPAGNAALMSAGLNLNFASPNFLVLDGPGAVDLVISGAIYGSGGVTKSGAGTVRFDGNPSNSFGGSTSVWDGVLELDNDLSNKAIPGALQIGDDSGAANSAVVRLLQSIEIADNATVGVLSDGLFDLNGRGDVIGWLGVSGGNVTLGAGVLQPSHLTMIGGAISDTGSGELRLPANVVAIADPAGNAGTITAAVNLNFASPNFFVVDGPGALDLAVSGVISGAGSVTKSGDGTLRFDGNPSNSFGGSTSVWEGVLELDNDGPNVAVPGPLEIGNDDGAAQTAVVRLLQGWQINNAAAVTVLSDGLLDINGYGENFGALDVRRGAVALGVGDLWPTSVTMTGGTINGAATGYLILSSNLAATSDGLGVPATIGAEIELNGGNRTFVVDDGPGAEDLIVSAAVNDFFATGSLRKSGDGTMTLSAANPFPGLTTIAAGKLALSGSLAGGLDASVGVFAPKGAPAVNGTVTIGGGARFEVRIYGTIPGTQYDRLDAGGAVVLAGALDIVASPGLMPGTSFAIINKTSGGPVNGGFAGLSEGGVFTASGYDWIIRYGGGTGNDVVLTIASALDLWRHTHFGTTANTGTAADSFDANGDGERNLMEFATAQNPHAATREPAAFKRNGSVLELTYTRSVAALRDGLGFQVEWSTTLAPGPWNTAGVTEFIFYDDGFVQKVRADVMAGGGPRCFLRLNVSR